MDIFYGLTEMRGKYKTWMLPPVNNSMSSHILTKQLEQATHCPESNLPLKILVV